MELGSYRPWDLGLVDLSVWAHVIKNVSQSCTCCKLGVAARFSFSSPPVACWSRFQAFSGILIYTCSSWQVGISRSSSKNSRYIAVRFRLWAAAIHYWLIWFDLLARGCCRALRPAVGHVSRGALLINIRHQFGISNTLPLWQSDGPRPSTKRF